MTDRQTLTDELNKRLREVRRQYYLICAAAKELRAYAQRKRLKLPFHCWTGTNPNYILELIGSNCDVVKAADNSVNNAGRAALMFAMGHLEWYVAQLLGCKATGTISKDLCILAEDCGFTEEERYHFVEHLRCIRNCVAHARGLVSLRKGKRKGNRKGNRKRNGKPWLGKYARCYHPEGNSSWFLPATDAGDARYLQDEDRVDLKYANVEGILICLCQFGSLVCGRDPDEIPEWALYLVWMRSGHLAKWLDPCRKAAAKKASERNWEAGEVLPNLP